MEGQDVVEDKEQKEKGKKTGKEGWRKRREKGIGVRETRRNVEKNGGGRGKDKKSRKMRGKNGGK